MSKENRTSLRAFVSLLLLFSFIVLGLSGIFLYFAPQCRVAEAISWRVLGLAKDQWGSLHMTFALVFLVLTLIHLLVYNWKTTVAYMKPRAKKILGLRPELFYALAGGLILLVGAALIVPPFSLLPDTHDAIQMEYREKSGIDEGREGRGEGEGRREGSEDSGLL